ncbi:hypothetical protein J3A83DRAFT_4359902 [Scleroderma citrinum]
MACPECGGCFIVDEELCSAVCSDCGHLNDPAQTLLADHIEYRSSYHAPIRKEHGKSLAAMSAFIASVLARLNHPGLSPRAHAIFTHAMTTGGYRWGRKANLIAGASIAVALRESNKSDSLRDIAFLLDDSHLSLSRAFQSVVSLLNFSLTPTDPSVHLSSLQTYLLTLVHSNSTSSLPADLRTVLTSLSLPAAVRIATSIAGIITAHEPTLAITHLPTPPTACALLILALEAETRTPLPHVSDLAGALAARFGLASGVVSSRYKCLYDTLEEWIREVPWLDQFTQSKSHGHRTRPKLSKRAVVAKGIRDIIQYKEEIWKKHMQTQHKISLVIEPDLGENPSAAASLPREGGINNSLQCTGESDLSSSSSSVSVAAKRRKTTHGSLYEAYQLLLNPFLSSTTLSRGSPSLHTRATASADRHVDVDISLATDLLTRPHSAAAGEEDKPQRVPPTRLQLLAISRGGSAPSDIPDDELFDPGELEGLLRSDAECKALVPLFELNWGSLAQDHVQDQQSPEGMVLKPNRNKKPARTETKRGAKRVNMDVLNRIFEQGTEASFSCDLFGEGTSPIGPRPGRHASPIGERHQQEEADAAPEIIEDWRSLSPEVERARGFWRFGDMASTGDECRYEEEW